MEQASWRRASPADAEVLGRFNHQLSADEDGVVLGPVSLYVERVRGWLETGRYQAALAWNGEIPVAYLLWREDEDYRDVFVRQFFVAREHRGQGLGRALFLDAIERFWPDCPLRLDVYDSNPDGLRFWRRVGFTPYSRLLRRPPEQRVGSAGVAGKNIGVGAPAASDLTG